MRRLIKNLNFRPPATDESIAAFEKACGMRLPVDYREFLKITNGGEGFIGENAYVMFWGVDELVSMNKAYEVDTYVPGFLLFGSNGGGEAFGFDTRKKRWTIVQVPFVGMEWSLAERLGRSFKDFLEKLFKVE